MCALILQAGDGMPMSVKRPASGSHWLVDEEAAISVFKSCLATVKRENPAVVVFNLIYTIKSTHKIELYYSLKGEKEISPMGTVVYEYFSMDMFKGCMQTDFSGLEYPI